MLIDWPFVLSTYNKIQQELLQINAIEQWVIPPQKLMPTKHKTKYGMADINGIIYINHAFIGTSAVGLLEATIRHEMAHLCVGLQHGHDHHFKAKAKQFKAKFGRQFNTESSQLHQAIGYKYSLYATLESTVHNGHEEILFKRVHRKHAKYLSYKPKRFRYLTIKGQKVLAFRYAE